ncbi:MAG TPA: zinc-binding alcohol dehydrogenase family protein [Acidothermaceae bacterium]
MRAARLVEHGKPLSIEQIQLPTPADDEVLVELAYAGVNPVDRYNALGSVAPDGPVPRTLGGEASGHADGVAVVVSGGGLGSTRDGLFAEAAVVPRTSVVRIPDGVSLRDAATVGIGALTVFDVVELATITAADRVLVLGGSGGVGLSLISYAASKGAQVWGQTGSASKADAMRAMGASRAVVGDAAAVLDTGGELNPTVVLDSLGGEFTASAVKALLPRGRLVLFGTSAGAEAAIPLQQLYRKRLQVIGYGGMIATPEERQTGIAGALAAMARGDLRVGIGAEFELGEVEQAFAALAEHTVAGKLLLRLR